MAEEKDPFGEPEDLSPSQVEFEFLFYRTLSEHGKDFERLLHPITDEEGITGGYLHFSLPNHPITAEYYNHYSADFEERLQRTIDKNLLVESELARFADYTNNEALFKRLPKDYRAKGYLWCMTGRYYTVNDFLHLKVEPIETHDIEPYWPGATVEQLKNKWLEVSIDIERAAEGYAIALFVLHLKGTNVNELKEAISDEQANEKDRATTKQAVLALEKLGVFDLPTISGKDLTKVARVIAPLIGRTYKNVYEAIRKRGKLDENENDLVRVTEILNHLEPEK